MTVENSDYLDKLIKHTEIAMDTQKKILESLENTRKENDKLRVISAYENKPQNEFIVEESKPMQEMEKSRIAEMFKINDNHETVDFKRLSEQYGIMKNYVETVLTVKQIKILDILLDPLTKNVQEYLALRKVKKE